LSLLFDILETSNFGLEGLVFLFSGMTFVLLLLMDLREFLVVLLQFVVDDF